MSRPLAVKRLQQMFSIRATLYNLINTHTSLTVELFATYFLPLNMPSTRRRIAGSQTRRRRSASICGQLRWNYINPIRVCNIKSATPSQAQSKWQFGERRQQVKHNLIWIDYMCLHLKCITWVIYKIDWIYIYVLRKNYNIYLKLINIVVILYIYFIHLIHKI